MRVPAAAWLAAARTPNLPHFRAVSDLGSRAIVMADGCGCHDKPQTALWLAAVVELCHHVLWMGEWTGVHPPWDGQLRNAPPLALLACCHCTVAQLTCCEPCMYRHHACSRWQRGIDKHARKSSWSAAPAERVNVASEVVRRQLWSWPSVEARPVLAWAELNALPCVAHVSWTHS